MIEEYRFGSIVIDGKAYNYDVEVRWTGEILPWPRKESHVVDVEDVKRAIEQNPELIIIGTGESGVAKATGAAEKAIKSKGIELIIDLTEEVLIYNIAMILKMSYT